MGNQQSATGFEDRNLSSRVGRDWGIESSKHDDTHTHTHARETTVKNTMTHTHGRVLCARMMCAFRSKEAGCDTHTHTHDARAFVLSGGCVQLDDTYTHKAALV